MSSMRNFDKRSELVKVAAARFVVDQAFFLIDLQSLIRVENGAD